MPYAQSVTGPVPAEALGATLLHEHILCDLRDPATRDAPADWPPITPQNRFEIDYFQNRHPPNMWLDDDGVAGAELDAFANAGGGTIVELTVTGLRPQPKRLAALSRASGVHIVRGAGHYVDAYLEPAVLALDREAIAASIRNQLLVGDDGVRCGLIGELGCSWPLTGPERVRLEAAATVQRETGAAITIHPGRHPDAPAEISDVLRGAGADLSRVVIGHMDRTVFDKARLVSLLRRGVVLEWDFFGIEKSQYWMDGVDLDLPTDYMRIDIIRDLADAGFAGSLAISHDICTRTRLQAYGGHGYGHILRFVVPIMRRRGVDDELIHTLLVETPRRLLAHLSAPEGGGDG